MVDMEQIYTIPVNEKFEASAADASLGCPFCALYNKLEEDELGLILGASMMEPDIRIKTNELGFCKTHFDMMFARKNRLPLALMLESHLGEVEKTVAGGGMSDLLNPGGETIKSLSKLDSSCYVCDRISRNFRMMVETAVLLWEKEEDFRKKTAAQPFFCLPHYSMFLEVAKDRMQKKRFGEFYKSVSSLEHAYAEEICGDVSWFCKKFDYRYNDEPWYNAKDSVPRARFCRDTYIFRPKTTTNDGQRKW